MPSPTEPRAARSHRLGLSRRLRSSVSALALGLVMTVGAGVQAPAHAEPSVQEVLQTLGPIAGPDGLVTEAELRGWIADLVANDPDPNSTPPTPEQIDALIDSVPSTTDGTGTRVFALQTIVLMTANEQLAENGGAWDGNSEPTLEQAAVIAQQVAGADGILSEAEFRAWAHSLTGTFQVSDADIDEVIARITAAGGTFSILTLLTAIMPGNDGSGDGGSGDGGTGGGTPVVDPPPSDPPPSNPPPVQTGWSCTFSSNSEICRNSPGNALSVSATRPGAAISYTNDTAITTTGNGGEGIVLQARPQFDGNGNPVVYAHPAMSLTNTAAITTSGMGASGITAWGYNGAVTINNTGAITTTGTGDWSSAIGLYNDYDAPSGDRTVVNSGAINSSGVGIFVQAVEGDTSITNTGAINADGFAAILVWNRFGDVLIENSGNLVAPGAWAAIAVNAENGNALVRNSGEITVTDAGAGGISVDAYMSDDGSDDGAASPYTAAIHNSGTIRLEGVDQNGLELEAPTGGEISNTGRILSSQSDATGINLSIDAEAGGNGTVSHSGEIALSGAHSIGINTVSPNGTVDIQSSGDVRATGLNGIGIFVGGIFGGTTRIDITGGAIQGGSGATTIGTENKTVDDGGTRLTGSAGILLLGGASNEIFNAGTIAALNGLAIATFEGALTVYEWDDEQRERVAFVLDIPIADTAITNRAGGLIDGMIRLGSGNDTIDNAGRVTGNVEMGAGANSFTNLAGGTLSGANLAVGTGNTFTNAGILSPGGAGTIAHTTIVGNFVQAVGGRMVIDINETADTRSDTISVTGSASLAGFVTPNVVNLNNVIESEYQVLTAAGGITDNGIAAEPARARVTDTVGYDFGLEQRDNAMFLTATRQSSPTGIASDASTAVGATGAAAGNFAALGGALEAAENGGNTSLTPVLNAIRLSETSEEAATVMDRLVPQQQGEQAGSATRSSTSFGNSMLSCATREGQYAYTREGKCYYAKLTLRRLDHDASSAGAGVTETGTEAMGGIQFDVGGERRLGLAFGYEDITSKSFSTLQTLGRSEGQRFQGGIVLKDQWGPINAYLNVTGSYTDVDGRRHVNMGGFTDARYDQEVMSGLVKLRLSYLHDMGAWYVKPLVDLGANYIHLGGYSEAGAGAFNLSVAATDKWLLSIMPGVEVGGEMRDGSGTIWRPYVRAGVTFYNDDTINVTTRFTEAPATIAGFNVATRLDTIYADIDAGMHILTASGLNLRFNYEGRYGESTRQHAGTVKVSLPY